MQKGRLPEVLQETSNQLSAICHQGYTAKGCYPERYSPLQTSYLRKAWFYLGKKKSQPYPERVAKLQGLVVVRDREEDSHRERVLLCDRTYHHHKMNHVNQEAWLDEDQSESVLVEALPCLSPPMMVYKLVGLQVDLHRLECKDAKG